MHFREATPISALRPYINSYWMIQAEPGVPIQDRTYPDGCQEIVFNINSIVMRSDTPGRYHRNPNVELIGQMTRYYDLETSGEQRYLGIKFYPHSFSAFTRESIHDLRDQSIQVREILGPWIEQAVDAVQLNPDFDAFVAAMNRYFCAALLRDRIAGKPYQLVDRAIKTLFAERDEMRVDTLRRQLDVGNRRLQALFQDYVGLSPKQLLKMVRFQTSFKFLHRSDLALTDVAMRCGYYDQAHFNHDFKTLAGVSPTQYRESRLPLNRFFLDENSLAYLCNSSRSG